MIVSGRNEIKFNGRLRLVSISRLIGSFSNLVPIYKLIFNNSYLLIVIINQINLLFMENHGEGLKNKY